MREIVLDTETTGLDPLQGHRLVEIGCIELLNRIPTGADLPPLPQSGARHAGGSLRHSRAVDRVPRRTSRCFAEIVDEFLAFIGDAPLVIHNAGFDHRLPQCRARARRAAADRARAAGRHAAAGAPQASGGAEPARRSVRALWDRQFAPHQARRAARRRTPGRGLSRADRRAAGAARPRARAASVAAMDATALWCGASAARRLPPRVSDAEREAHRAFVATLGDKRDLERDYLAGRAPELGSASCGAGAAACLHLAMFWR